VPSGIVTSLIKARLSVQTAVGVGAKGRMVVWEGVINSRVDVGEGSGAGNGIGELLPLQAVVISPTQRMPV
jgi:hypothetical protein